MSPRIGERVRIESSQTSRKSFWLMLHGADCSTHATTQMDAMRFAPVLDAQEIWECIPDECRMRNVTEDMAHYWWGYRGELGDDVPAIYLPFLADKVAQRAVEDIFEAALPCVAA